MSKWNLLADRYPGRKARNSSAVTSHRRSRPSLVRARWMQRIRRSPSRSCSGSRWWRPAGLIWWARTSPAPPSRP